MAVKHPSSAEEGAWERTTITTAAFFVLCSFIVLALASCDDTACITLSALKLRMG